MMTDFSGVQFENEKSWIIGPGSRERMRALRAVGKNDVAEVEEKAQVSHIASADDT
jgi:hypothetical protein